ncbi:MAG TPA: hypothetical protein VEL74_18745 [Thermoanaerobaculia bacterium]|nr:hypothetical protein [Thermoanaerobaculia bacterium]
MRRVFVLMGVVGLLVWALMPGLPASASQMCSTSCGATTIQCCVSTGTCTSSAGSLNCNGTVYTCDAINAYNACKLDCLDRYMTCRSFCTDRTCLSECAEFRTWCIADCGPMPQTSFGC